MYRKEREFCDAEDVLKDDKRNDDDSEGGVILTGRRRRLLDKSVESSLVFSTHQ